MEICCKAENEKNWHADILIIPLFNNESILTYISNSIAWIKDLTDDSKSWSKKNCSTILYGPKNAKIQRICIIGLGDKEKIKSKDLKLSIAKAIQSCWQIGISSILFNASIIKDLPFGLNRIIEEFSYAINLSLKDESNLKKSDDTKFSKPKTFTFIFNSKTIPNKINESINKGTISANATLLARELANYPSNLLTPDILAKKAQKLAKENNFSCKILNEKDLLKEKMGAHLAVGQGSINPPRLVVLEYNPKNNKNDNPLIFIGKGITFDSGGISLKPANNMHQMKCDMTGAAVVLAALSSLAKEKINNRVIGILSLAENMPDGNSIKPGDVIKAKNNDTIEITNTDAEGRLVLCDALCYAQEKYKPKAIVDIATLTGACAVALGTGIAGLFSNCDDLADKICTLGNSSDEYFWRLPLFEEYKEQLKSSIADICHTGSREGGAINAALFLKHFVKNDIKWAHLDIAGVDWNNKENPLCFEGATGFGARTLLELARGGI